MLSRRQFVQGLGAAGLGLVAGCGRLPWQAPPEPRVFRIGYLSLGLSEDSFYQAFLQGLLEHGLVEDQNIIIDYRYPDTYERLPEAAAALVSTTPDVIVTSNNALVLALKNATSTIPIVGRTMGYPVESGLIASIAHTGGNVTGWTSATGMG